MQKVKNILVPFSIFIADFILIVVSFILSYFLRYGIDIPKTSIKPFQESFLALALLYSFSFVYIGLFRARYKSRWQVIEKTFSGVLLGTLFSFMFLYIFRIRFMPFPSSVFAIIAPIAIILVSVFNVIILSFTKSLKKNVVIVGENKEPEIVINRSRLDIQRVKNIEDILRLSNIDDIDEIIICEHIHEDSQLNLLIYLLNKLKITVSFTPVLYATLLSDSINNANTLKFLATSLGRKLDHEEHMIRFLDIVGSLFLLIASFIPMLIISIVIKLTSKGPVFYSQQRAGKDGRSFILYKFRTMIKDADMTPVTAGDFRITMPGKLLRQLRLDELPQLFNIFKGDMSLVGPRPENFHRVQQHRALQGLRMAIRPGLTGLAQIRSCYDLHPEHKIKYDYLYIQRRSLLLNIYILLQTIPVVLGRKGQ